MIGLDIDNYGEDLVAVCTDCGWAETLKQWPAGFEWGVPPYGLADIVALTEAHDCSP